MIGLALVIPNVADAMLPIRAIVVLNLLGIFFLIWILNLVRRGRLYVGYAIIFIVAIVGTMITLSVPQLLATVTHLVGAIFPASALTLLALCFIVLLLLYILTQLTLVSNRLTTLVQELAIERTREQMGHEQARINGPARNLKETQ